MSVVAPHRVQLRRIKGWRMPENTVSVARPGRWGNPFLIGGQGPFGRIAPDAAGAVGFFRAMLRDPELRAEAGYPSDEVIVRELRGHNLACWCADDVCHATVLLEVANR